MSASQELAFPDLKHEMRMCVGLLADILRINGRTSAEQDLGFSWNIADDLLRHDFEGKRIRLVVIRRSEVDIRA